MTFAALHVFCLVFSVRLLISAKRQKKCLLYVLVRREMKKKKGGNDGGRRTKWLPLDVETRRRRGQIICKR